jgi:tRNA 2-thiouridine synthesizing protein A
MNERLSLEEETQTSELLASLQAMQGLRCAECAALLCGHETLISLVAGCQNLPRCLPCLSRLMGRSREEFRDHVFGYIMNRPCRRAGWLWANQQERTEPFALPICLWAPGSERADHQLPAMAEIPDMPAPDRTPDAEWDAGTLGCGELVMELRTRLQSMRPGQVLKLMAADPGMPEDLPAWCRLTGHKLIHANHPVYWIQRREN